jgi:hypothetical protein
MTVALAILQHYRANRNAIKAEVPNDGLKSDALQALKAFEERWRGAQNLLRTPVSKLDTSEYRRERTAAHEVLYVLTLTRHTGYANRAVRSFYELPDFQEAIEREEFIDFYLGKRLMQWLHETRARLTGGDRMSFSFKRKGGQLTLTVELQRGQANAVHTVTLEIPAEGYSMLGEALIRIAHFGGEVRTKAAAVLEPKNWPTDASVDEAAERAARAIADSLFRPLSRSQIAQMAKHEGSVLAALRKASRY